MKWEVSMLLRTLGRIAGSFPLFFKRTIRYLEEITVLRICWTTSPRAWMIFVLFEFNSTLSRLDKVWYTLKSRFRLHSTSCNTFTWLTDDSIGLLQGVQESTTRQKNYN